VDLGTGTLHVRAAKTEKGVREVHLTSALCELLTLSRADRKNSDTGYVIATATGRNHNASNLRRDVLNTAVTKANVKLDKLGIAPIEHCTFHSLRRTFASHRCAVGDTSLEVADQIGHQDARFTERVYRQATKRRDRLAPIHRREYDRAVDWARMGTGDPLVVPDSVAANSL
jgi:integrase